MSPVVADYKDLIAWQKSMDLATQVYRVTQDFPTEERFGLVSQVRRAAVSVPSNIAEGQGRNTKGEFIQFLGNARGSLHEVETQVELAQRLQLLNEKRASELLSSINEVARILGGLMSSLRQGQRQK